MDRREKLTTWLHYNMALVGGFFGAFAVMEFGTLANAHTTNLIKVALNLSDGNWQEMSLFLLCALTYFAAFALATVLKKRERGDLRYLAIALDALALPAIAFFPGDLPAYMRIYPCVFATAFQWSQFSGARGFNCSTIFNSNNYRQFSTSFAEVFLNHDDTFRPKMRLFGFTLLFYHIGAVYAYLVWKALSYQAIWFCLVPLGAAAAVLRLVQRAGPPASGTA